MNYTLSKNTDKQIDINNFQYLTIQKDDTLNIEKDIYPILFIIKGSVVLHFKTHSTTLTEGYLSMINSSSLTHITIPQASNIIVYFPRINLTGYLKKCSFIFKIKNSLPILFNEKMHTWVNELKTEIDKDTDLSSQTSATYCQKLVDVLMEYHQSELGELYVPFIACSRGYCNKSKTPHCYHPTK